MTPTDTRPPWEPPTPVMCCPHCFKPVVWRTDLATYETILECSEEPEEHMVIRFSADLPRAARAELYHRWELEMVRVGMAWLDHLVAERRGAEEGEPCE